MSSKRIPVQYEPVKDPLKVAYRKRLQEDLEAKDLIKEFLAQDEIQKEKREYIDRYKSV